MYNQCNTPTKTKLWNIDTARLLNCEIEDAPSRKMKRTRKGKPVTRRKLSFDEDDEDEFGPARKKSMKDSSFIVLEEEEEWLKDSMFNVRRELDFCPEGNWLKKKKKRESNSETANRCQTDHVVQVETQLKSLKINYVNRI